MQNVQSSRAEEIGIPEPTPLLTVAALKELLSHDRNLRKRPIRSEPSEQQLAVAAESLVHETGDRQLIAYLRLFWHRVFPGLIDRLLDLAHSENKRVAHWALTALSNLSDPRVRELGRKLISESKSWGVRLLVRNAEPGDYFTVESLLRSDLKPDELHRLGIGVRKYFEQHEADKSERSLLFLYEHGPCSLCRASTVQQLIEIACLPAWMAEECRYDACSDTRQLVSSLQ